MIKTKLLIFFTMLSLCAHAQTDPSHHVPQDKRLSASWQRSLYADGPQTWTGGELTTIGMPCGGIAAGQLYVRGDGTLACWWICNNAYNTGQGAKDLWNFKTPLGSWKTGYQTYTPVSYIDEGFTIKVTTKGKTVERPLDKTGFNAISFRGEYPVATIGYADTKQSLPVQIQLKVFSPFIPLDADDSATPGTVMQYELKNDSKTPETITLTGHLQNPVGLDLKGKITGTSHNRVIKGEGMTSFLMDLTKTSLPAAHPFNGNVCLSVLDDKGFGTSGEKLLGKPLIGSAGTTVSLKPGESKTITFLVTWYFPNRPYPEDGGWNQALNTEGPVIGNNYANRFDSSLDVAEWLKSNLPRLQEATFAFVDAYYHKQTLPYWLSRRVMMPVSNLATETAQWWSNGKFWAWEGVGSCFGTCTHVWNYAQGMAQLFPELERNVREQTDFATSFSMDGKIAMRNGTGGWAIDGQAGTVLKAYREHLMSKDNLFLERNWAKIKQAEQYLIQQDSTRDGLIAGRQPNTYDIAFFGANTFTGSLYLASLKAAARMATIMRDSAFAKTCDSIAENGRINTEKRLWNGHYFIQQVDSVKHPRSQYGKGCLSDQLFGQTWADLTGLGELYDPNKTRTALRSIYTYNWAKDVAEQNKYHAPERPFADPGEAGLFICTWPFSTHPGNKGIRYADEVWTGVEYQVATGMISEGMTKEGLSIIKGLDERYDPKKHNPYDEFECGDHYARSLASYGVLLALEGWHYDGPAASISFDPRLTPGHFSGFFTSAEGWGNITQERNQGQQVNTMSLAYGKLSLRSITVKCSYPVKSVHLQADKQVIACTVQQSGDTVQLDFSELTLKAGQQLKMILMGKEIKETK